MNKTLENIRNYILLIFVILLSILFIILYIKDEIILNKPVKQKIRYRYNVK